MSRIKVVAFDCDGVMFDSEQANTAYYNTILAHFSLPEMNPGQSAYSHTHTVDQSLTFLFNDPITLVAAQDYRKTIGYLPFLKHMKIEPTLRSLLDELRPAYKTAIATNRTDTMHRVLETNDLTGLFDLVVTALDVRNPKPHPEPIRKILDYFNIKPAEAVYIGDSELDEAAAVAAGVPFVSYRNPELKAELNIEQLADIIPFLKE
ncbi:MAG: HAD family hydrolase [Desulfobacteraceae bacterium]|nr:HAD family hydrolase [Desulfobacteraceae bacterium]